MAARKKKPKSERKPRASRPAPAADAQATGADAAATPAAPRRDLRPLIYAVLDAVAVLAWAGLLVFALPNRHSWASAYLWTMIAMGGVMGAAMFVRTRWGWRVSVAACAVLIAMWLVLIVILLMTAGFLAGVYGGFGQAAALGVIGFAFLTLQIIALLPAFQLKYLMTRAGRRHFALEPLWR